MVEPARKQIDCAGCHLSSAENLPRQQQQQQQQKPKRRREVA